MKINQLPEGKKNIIFNIIKFIKFTINSLGQKSKKSFSSILNHLIDDYQKEGLITHEEKLMYKNITNFSDKKVNTIMTPRADIISVKYNSNLEEVKKIINEDGHTRLPVFKNNNEEIIGFIHTKDMARYLCQENKIFNIDNILRKILFIPGSMKLPDVLLRMRISRVHMAIVLDEFGGIDGLVTIENIVEEIIGDIEDEHDIIENDSFFTIKKIDDSTFQFGGRVDINKAQDLLKTDIINANEPDNYQTIGGFILYYFNRIPEIGEEIEKFNLNFRIIDSNNRVVKLIEVKKAMLIIKHLSFI